MCVDAKPRSSPTELYEGREIPSFRGDNVNGFDPSDRKPDPQRLLSAYFHSGITLNSMRGLLAGGFADLHSPRQWSLAHVRSPTLHSAFENVVDRLEDSLDFMRVIGADPSAGSASGEGFASSLQSVDMFVSHEGLLLEYEEPLTRLLARPGRPAEK